MLNNGRIVSSNWASSPCFAFANIHLMVVYISFRLRWPASRCRKKLEQNVLPLLPEQLMEENNGMGMLLEGRAMNSQQSCHVKVLIAYDVASSRTLLQLVGGDFEVAAVHVVKTGIRLELRSIRRRTGC